MAGGRCCIRRSSIVANLGRCTLAHDEMGITGIMVQLTEDSCVGDAWSGPAAPWPLNMPELPIETVQGESHRKGLAQGVAPALPYCTALAPPLCAATGWSDKEATC